MTQGTPQRPGLRAHEESIRLDTPVLVKELRELLGAKLVAYLGACENEERSEWAEESRTVQNPTDERRLRLAYQIARLIGEKGQSWGRAGLVPGPEPPAGRPLARSPAPRGRRGRGRSARARCSSGVRRQRLIGCISDPATCEHAGRGTGRRNRPWPRRGVSDSAPTRGLGHRGSTRATTVAFLVAGTILMDPSGRSMPASCWPACSRFLARFRPDPLLEEDLNGITVDPEDAESSSTLRPGVIPTDWLEPRQASTATLSGVFCAVTDKESLPTLREMFLRTAINLGLSDLDAGARTAVRSTRLDPGHRTLAA